MLGNFALLSCFSLTIILTFSLHTNLHQYFFKFYSSFSKCFYFLSYLHPVLTMIARSTLCVVLIFIPTYCYSCILLFLLNAIVSLWIEYVQYEVWSGKGPVICWKRAWKADAIATMINHFPCQQKVQMRRITFIILFSMRQLRDRLHLCNVGLIITAIQQVMTS